jgi:Starch/carbohydrate-binding module (family 53)
MTTLNKIFPILVALLCACGDVGPDTTVASTGDTIVAALGQNEQSTSRVFVSGSGSWNNYVYHGVTRESFWVDLSVANESPNKEVGIVWTLDGWATSRRSLASYKGTLADGREKWGIDVADFATSGPNGRPSVEFAAFATVGTSTSWSPFRNHFIYDAVTPAKPIRLMRTSISLNGGVVRLEGVTRALRTQTARTVIVRYTLDEWKTSADVKATASGDEHAFSVLLPVVASSEEVQFAVQLQAAGQTAWDNADGNNYRQRLAPTLEASLQGVTSTQSMDGILNLAGSAKTALPLSSVQVRIDSAPWASLPTSIGTTPALGFAAEGSFRSVLSTMGLSRGAHRLAVKVGAGPFVRETSVDFAVGGALASASSMALPSTINGLWDIDRAPNGTVFVVGEQGVARLDSSMTTATAFEAPPTTGAFLDVEATDTAVFGLNNQSTLVKWNAATTQVVRAFGVNGALQLTQSNFGGLPVCYASSFTATATALFVADSCNSRLLRLSPNGTFVDELRLGNSGLSTIGLPVVQGNRVWLVGSGPNGSELVSIATASGLAEVERIKLSLPNSISALAVTADGFWVSTGADLRRLNRTGTQTSRWVGGDLYDVTLPGVLSIANQIEVLGDGTVEVLSLQTRRLERFRLLP